MRTFVRIACVMLAAVAGIAYAADAPSLVLLNGKIITVDDRFTIQQAVAVRDDRIVAVGSSEQIREMVSDGTQVVDLQGRTVIPGLIDNHTHIVRGTEHWSNEARLEGVSDRKELLEVLRAKAQSLPKGEWLLTLGGWYEDQLTGDRSDLTRRELDQIAPDRPAFIQAKYDHAFVNTAWFKAMNIPLRVRGPQEPQRPTRERTSVAEDVERDADGVATGRLNGGLRMANRAAQRFPTVTEERQVTSIEATQRYFNSIGLTSVYDAGGIGVADASYERLGKLADAGRLTLRIMYTLGEETISSKPEDSQKLLAKLQQTRPFQGNEWFDRIGLGEIYYSPFHWDDLVDASTPTEGDVAAARAILTAAAAGGWPVQTHAVQPSTIDRLLDVMEQVNREHPLRGLRWSITHADNIGAAQIERAKHLGMNLQIRSQRVIGDVAGAIRKHGHEAVLDMPRLRLIQDSGIQYGLGTDGTKAAQINPFITLWWAVTGKTLAGERITRELLTREEALIAHTRANAFLMFQEARIGAIRPGLLADFLVLDRDYLEVPEDEIRHIRPVATVVGGKVVYGALGQGE